MTKYLLYQNRQNTSWTGQAVHGNVLGNLLYMNIYIYVCVYLIHLDDVLFKFSFACVIAVMKCKDTEL